MIGLEISTDVRGFSLFTLPPQVRDEFWDLYKNCFHQRVYVSSKATTSSKG
ncbi:BnaC03g24030D [Brassica napus]|nr:BnaC03g24030D [Brassica napus]